MSNTDYAVKVTIRNGRILSRMRAKGIKSLSELAEKAGIPYSKLCGIVGLKERPIGVRGAWKAGIENVAGVLGCDVDDLFTDAQRENLLERNSGEIYMDEPEVMALTLSDLERAYMIKTEAQRLLGAIKSDRTRDIIVRHIEGDTLKEIADDLGLSHERVRQIEGKALRQMRGMAMRAGFSARDLDAA